MNKLVLFLALVIVVVFGFVIMSSQNNSKSPEIQTVDTAPTAQPSVPKASTSATPTTIETIDEIVATTATIKTSKGNITLTLYPKEAPKTVANFVKKSQDGFYDNLTFHRVEDWVIQGGDPLGTGTGGGNMSVEFNAKPFVVGSLGVASRGDGKVQNDAQFFITKTDASWLNRQYTNFGIVTSGMDVVNKIAVGDKILSISVE